jgi:two-component system sensor histidine kinase/response regulator
MDWTWGGWSRPTEARQRKPVEVGVLKELVGNDPEVISEFLRDFRASSGRIAAEIRSSCQMKQAQVAGAAAHKLKSSARSVGALVWGALRGNGAGGEGK